jgi:magnesium chelatase family protein
VALDEYASLAPDAVEQLEFALRAGKLSARGYQRVRAVSLTIADLAGAPRVERAHLAEALQLRSPLLETVFAEVGNGY